MTDDQFYIDAARRLRELRERGFNESPGQFAKRLGMTERNYLAYEEGRRTRGWNRYIVAIGETGASLDWLFRGVGQMIRAGAA